MAMGEGLGKDMVAGQGDSLDITASNSSSLHSMCFFG